MNGIHEVRGSIPLSSTINFEAKGREGCKAMRLSGLKSWLFCIAALLMAGAFSGCDNPFDPLSTSDKIQGLTYFDFSADLEYWDSDQERDGIQISMKYYNEYGDQLNFHDKPHTIQIEFWSQKEEVVEDKKKISRETELVREDLLFSKTVEFSNSDDFIRIPTEAYVDSLDLSDGPEVKGYLLVRVFPPQEYPQKELDFLMSDVTFYDEEAVPVEFD